jgi:transposase-like protein
MRYQRTYTRETRAVKWDHATEGQLQAWRLVRSGMSYRQAARALGVSKSTIQQRIEAMRWRRQDGLV